MSANEASAPAAPQRTQGMLFGDPLPELDVNTGYRGPVACRAAGITYRQLDYWARTGLVEPSIRGAKGSGSQRLYAFRDILLLKIVKRLLDTGVSLQQIRIAVNALHERGVEDLTAITLMSDGASVYECTSADEVVDLVRRAIFRCIGWRAWYSAVRRWLHASYIRSFALRCCESRCARRLDVPLHAAPRHA